jgi:hypothetical protein
MNFSTASILKNGFSTVKVTYFFKSSNVMFKSDTIVTIKPKSTSFKPAPFALSIPQALRVFSYPSLIEP